MTIRCVRNVFPTEDPDLPTWHADLTLGRDYEVIAVGADWYRIIGDDGCPCLYPPDAFVVTDPSVPADWTKRYGSDGEIYAGPAELLQRGLFEDYFDGVPEARHIVNKYINKR